MKQNSKQEQLTPEQIALGYMRIWDVVGDRKRNIPGVLPIGRSTFLAKCKSGEYPAGIKIAPRTTVWPRASIMALLETLAGDKGAA